MDLGTGNIHIVILFLIIPVCFFSPVISFLQFLLFQEQQILLTLGKQKLKNEKKNKKFKDNTRLALNLEDYLHICT